MASKFKTFILLGLATTFTFAGSAIIGLTLAFDTWRTIEVTENNITLKYSQGILHECIRNETHTSCYEWFHSQFIDELIGMFQCFNFVPTDFCILLLKVLGCSFDEKPIVSCRILCEKQTICFSGIYRQATKSKSEKKNYVSLSHHINIFVFTRCEVYLIRFIFQRRM